MPGPGLGAQRGVYITFTRYTVLQQPVQSIYSILHLFFKIKILPSKCSIRDEYFEVVHPLQVWRHQVQSLCQHTASWPKVGPPQRILQRQLGTDTAFRADHLFVSVPPLLFCERQDTVCGEGIHQCLMVVADLRLRRSSGCGLRLFNPA